ncbi:MAG: SLATT domain-containing protein [Hyphomicrobiaceae bacterium]
MRNWDEEIASRIKGWQRDSRLPEPASAPPTQRVADAAREKYRRDWRRVKRARFNASKRLERKDEASMMALAMAGMFGFIIPYFVEVFEETISQHLVNVLDFTSFIAGGLSLVVGLIELSKDYKTRAAALHRCGLRVNKCVRALEARPNLEQSGLDKIVSSYELALEECGENHNSVDDKLGVVRDRLKQVASPEERKQAGRALTLLRLRELIDIYCLYLLIWLAPIAIGILVWYRFE